MSYFIGVITGLVGYLMFSVLNLDLNTRKILYNFRTILGKESRMEF